MEVAGSSPALGESSFLNNLGFLTSQVGNCLLFPLLVIGAAILVLGALTPLIPCPGLYIIRKNKMLFSLALTHFALERVTAKFLGSVNTFLVVETFDSVFPGFYV